jgi:hypothetical protein
MAGVTSPTMMKGTMNERNWLNMALNVIKQRSIPTGIKLPNAMPSTMAMIMRGSSAIFIFLILQIYSYYEIIVRFTVYIE